jgi:NNP family nitrate/nitrite transporter-like MFS transporter
MSAAEAEETVAPQIDASKNDDTASVSSEQYNDFLKFVNTPSQKNLQKSVEVQTGGDAQWKKYQTYSVNVDPNQDDKATEIKLLNFKRPHMRAFHCSWGGFFTAFFIWFAIAPLLPEVKVSLGLTPQQVWTSNICSVAGTIFMRFINGPLCDKYGARILMGVILAAASIPCALTGLVQNSVQLSILRFFIGLGGSTFVMCQYWTSRMFTKEVAGTANALVGGWGNLGGGVTQIVMGSVLFPLFKLGMTPEQAWRSVCVVPAVVGFCLGLMIIKISDDAPTGNYAELKKNGAMPEVSAAASFRSGALNFNTWLLFIQYACCFGVELTMNNAAASYFKGTFDLSTKSAAAIASIFGWMNLFARGVGGFVSDKTNARMGMRGRLIWQTICLVIEGIMVLIFANTNSLGLAIFIMVIFSSFVQAAEGSTYGIVPYVNPPCTGSIAGIVGAGGNVGAVCFGLGFRQMGNYKAFMLMGSCIIASGVISLFICIKGHRGLITGQDSDEVIAAYKKTGAPAATTLQIPEQDAEAAAEVEK